MNSYESGYKNRLFGSRLTWYLNELKIVYVYVFLVLIFDETVYYDYEDKKTVCGIMDYNNFLLPLLSQDFPGKKTFWVHSEKFKLQIFLFCLRSTSP